MTVSVVYNIVNYYHTGVITQSTQFIGTMCVYTLGNIYNMLLVFMFVMPNISIALLYVRWYHNKVPNDYRSLKPTKKTLRAVTLAV